MIFNNCTEFANDPVTVWDGHNSTKMFSCNKV